jgi:uncharacterized protein
MTSCQHQSHSALQEFRVLRESLETSVLPLATSVDGRRFVFQASLHGLALQVGGYVALVTDEETRLGQVLSLEMTRVGISLPDGGGEVLIRAAQGHGVVLDGRTAPFHDAQVRPATSEEVAAWLERERPRSAALDVGELALAPGVSFALDGAGFGRHTLLCGQSGSGKTYSLGVLLEQLLMETRVRVLVLDPNSDYVGLAQPRSTVDPPAAAGYLAAAGHIVVRSGSSGASRLGLHFRDLEAAQQAALLRLDPVADRDEYAELVAIAGDANPASFDELEGGGDEARGLARRGRNLGVDRFGLWSGHDDASILNDLADPNIRCLVADLGSLDSPPERSLAAGAVLEQLWSRRARREPMMIVIDEAHNVCPAHPGDPLDVLTTEAVVRIAGEGRKFGVYLILVTQRPQKVHENVLSQCDNLVLMRMNSAGDLAHLAEVFSFVPPGLVDRAATFGQGEALVAGKISSHPALITFGARISNEGGTDVSGWA